MIQITLTQIFDKICSICKECANTPVPERYNADNQKSSDLENYFLALEDIRIQIIKFHNLEDEYSRLQSFLQRQQTEIRKRIGTQQQLRLYSDALKLQVEELEKEKMELLETSKVYIRNLKKTNQMMFLKLQGGNKHASASKQRQVLKKANKSLSQHNHPDKSIRDIVKTEYIERDNSNSAGKGIKSKKGQKLGFYSIVQQPQNIYENGKTYQMVNNNTGNKEKAAPFSSKKKNNHLFSNFTLFNFMNSSRKKMKKQQKRLSNIVKSPPKKDKEKKKQKESKFKNSSSIKMREKREKVNRSIFSLTVADGKSNKKQNP